MRRKDLPAPSLGLQRYPLPLSVVLSVNRCRRVAYRQRALFIPTGAILPATLFGLPGRPILLAWNI